MGCDLTKLYKAKKGITSDTTVLDKESSFKDPDDENPKEDMEKITRISSQTSMTSQLNQRRSLYKLMKLRELKTLDHGHSASVLKLERVSDTKMISIGLDRQIILWDMITMLKLCQMDAYESIYDLSVFNNWLVGVVGGERNRILVWEIAQNFSSVTVKDSLDL